MYRPYSQEEMDKFYQIYASYRLEYLKNLTESELERLQDNDIRFYTIEKASEDNIATGDDQLLLKRQLDVTSLVSFISFIYSQLDVVTALGVVANLESRAQYDPQFRTSFPGFLRQNSWFL
jgi:hypothetical protein